MGRLWFPWHWEICTCQVPWLHNWQHEYLPLPYWSAHWYWPGLQSSQVTSFSLWNYHCNKVLGKIAECWLVYEEGVFLSFANNNNDKLGYCYLLLVKSAKLVTMRLMQFQQLLKYSHDMNPSCYLPPCDWPYKTFWSITLLICAHSPDYWR